MYQYRFHICGIIAGSTWNRPAGNIGKSQKNPLRLRRNLYHMDAHEKVYACNIVLSNQSSKVSAEEAAQKIFPHGVKTTKIANCNRKTEPSEGEHRTTILKCHITRHLTGASTLFEILSILKQIYQTQFLVDRN